MKRGGEKSINFGMKIPPMKIESLSSSKRNKKPSLRNPLTDVNSSSSSSSTSTSTVSIEASSRGCLGFFLSNPSKPQLKNPKSVPFSNPKLKNHPQNHEKPVFNKGIRGNSNQKLGGNVKNLSLKSQSGLKKKKKLESEAMGIDKGEIFDQNLFNFSKLGLDETINVTPLHKFQCGSVLDMEIEENSIGKTLEKTPKTITPPIQASVSPELQYGSSMVGGSTTGSCYAAGHVLSGVPDKRKCRPRGILTVGEELGFESFQLSSNENVSSSGKGRRVSLVPTPSGASMRWLLSPCKEEDDQKDNCSPNASAEFRRRMGPTPFHSLSSPSSDVCLKSKGSSKTSSVVKMDSSISPIELSKFEGFSDVSPSIFQVRPDVEHHLVSCFSPSSFADTTTTTIPSKRVEESSPSSVDSLDSHNAVCTPQSDSSSEKQREFSWMKNVVDHRESRFEFDPMADVFRTKSLSPRGRRSSWDPADVLPLPGLNFKLHDTMTDPILGVSSSSFRDSVDSQMRISWREGLVSRIIDMDELDSCRWLSDEQEEVGLCGNKQFTSGDFNCEVDMSLESLDDELVNITNSPEFVSEEREIIGKNKLNSPQKPRSCAESMSTDGGGLIASGDSDWTQCYKNHLFQG
ncbi:hypothetical protein MKX01_038711 [Papaver californicum]|nr:hypothetical protein MKX01_038711 [Papaver californicum]